MKKRIVLALMAAALSASALVGCGNNGSSSAKPSETTGSSASSSSQESSEESVVSESDPNAEAIAARTQPQKIVVNWFSWVGSPGGLQRITDAMNELTVPALNLEVEMQVTDYASRSQQLTLVISGGEQLDIANSSGLGYTTGIQNEYWEDMEQEVNGYNLLETYGSGIIDLIGWDTINACRSPKGILYGITQQKENAQGRFALSLRTDCLKNAESYMDLVPDYENELWKVNGLDDLVTIIKAVHDGNPDMDATAGGAVAGWTTVDNLGGDYFGVLSDYGQGESAKTVVSYFDDPSYLAAVKAKRELFQYGCINPNDLTDTTAASTRIIAGTLASYGTNFKPGSKIQETTLCGKNDMTIIVGGENFVSSTSIASMPWCITVNTEDPVAAMQYLNFMYTSSEWNELFKWGIKDVDFEEIDGTAKFKEGSDYMHAMQWLAPGQFTAMPEYGNPSNIWDLYEEFNDNAVISEASGFAFDTSPVANEYTAVTNVYNEYQKAIEYGVNDPEPLIEEMKARLESAGYQNIIDEKQRQYDAWREANGKN